ncbi:hypothetical protein [Maridesulfovibrio salexigens]|uniref:Uncharacterized protein n=1 Tax=Maridesulfovibrio salexigens (strain ATCC 14822 / DSM 2638 / NCIMB 8403 / VKM B-1763) TaxID=526222 RepID=C6BWA4_MARSD|nr:hypothetical protein [Maridesulfovibrio salexigens]ACS78348.1 hypothetical protein Desal_0281 [Maridesulfovibrio salexigens DSM 2638]
MKIIRAVAMTVVLVGLMVGNVFAQETVFKPQGSAFVSGIAYHNDGNFAGPMVDISVSNVTGKTIECKITILDDDGNDMSSMGSIVRGGMNSYTVVKSGTGSFSLPPHATRKFTMEYSSAVKYMLGQAIVQWSSDDPNLARALTASVVQAGSASPLNGGQPF